MDIKNNTGLTSAEINNEFNKAKDTIEAYYERYQKSLKSLSSNATLNDIQQLNVLANVIKETVDSLVKPTTSDILEELVVKNVIKPEFRIAYNTMFDNLINDPLKYFFAKYEGTKYIEHEGVILALRFQFERKLYTMCFEHLNLSKYGNEEQATFLFKEMLTVFYKIRECFLRDLLGATGDLITYLKLVEDSDVDNDNLSPQFYDYVYNKITAFKTLASVYEADVFVNNPTVNKCREMESDIDDIISKTQKWLLGRKTEIAKFLYTTLV